MSKSCCPCKKVTNEPCDSQGDIVLNTGSGVDLVIPSTPTSNHEAYIKSLTSNDSSISIVNNGTTVDFSMSGAINSTCQYRLGVDPSINPDPLTNGLIIPAGSADFQMPLTYTPLGLNIAENFRIDPLNQITLQPTSGPIYGPNNYITINQSGIYFISFNIFMLKNEVTQLFVEILQNGIALFTSPPQSALCEAQGCTLPPPISALYSNANSTTSSGLAYLNSGDTLSVSVNPNNTFDAVISLSSNMSIFKLGTTTGSNNNIDMSNVGGFSELVQNPGTGTSFDIKTIQSSDSSIVITDNGNNLDLTTAGSSSITMSNVGGFEPVLKNPGVGSSFDFRTLQSSDTSININPSVNDLDLTVNFPAVPDTLYSNDGTLAGPRTVDMDGNTLTFQGDGGNTFDLNNIGIIQSTAAITSLTSDSGFDIINATSGDLRLNAGTSQSLLFDNIPSNTTADILYYDSASKSVTYGSVPTVTANTIYNADDIITTVGGTRTVGLNGNDLVFQGTNVEFAAFNDLANFNVLNANGITFTANNFVYQSLTGGGGFQCNDNVGFQSDNGNVTLTSLSTDPNEGVVLNPTNGGLYFYNILNATTANALYYDTVSKVVTYGALPPAVNIFNSNGSLTSARTLSLNGFNFNITGAAATQINLTSGGNTSIVSTSGSLTLATNSNSQIININLSPSNGTLRLNNLVSNTQDSWMQIASGTKNVNYVLKTSFLSRLTTPKVFGSGINYIDGTTGSVWDTTDPAGFNGYHSRGSIVNMLSNGFINVSPASYINISINIEIAAVAGVSVGVDSWSLFLENTALPNNKIPIGIFQVVNDLDNHSFCVSGMAFVPSSSYRVRLDINSTGTLAVGVAQSGSPPFNPGTYVSFMVL